MLLFAILVSLLAHYAGALGETSGSPAAVGKLKLQSKPVLAGAAAAGLIAGKRLVNGPNFDEEVSLAGKTAVITGGNTGLGKETAVKLAALGANTVILCKTPARATSAVEEIIERSKAPTDRVRYLTLDLADLGSVRKCAEGLKATVDQIDVLVNNAGVMAIPEREETVDGFEKHLGINHMGHYALTGQLMPLIRKGARPGAAAKRIVNVSSAAHLLGKLDTTDLMLQKADAYGPWLAYGNSKLANILFTRELTRRMQQQQADNGIVSVCCHPGGCRTELGRYIVDPDSIPQYLLPVLGVAAAPLLYFTKSAEEGAQTQIYLSASDQLSPADSGKYYDNSAPAGTSPEAQSTELAQWLWTESERLTGVKYNFV